MKSFGSRVGIGVAVAAAALAVVWSALVPYGYPWPSLAWATLACVAAVWVGQRSFRPSPSMSDVINDLEGEPARATAGPGRKASTRVVL